MASLEGKTFAVSSSYPQNKSDDIIRILSDLGGQHVEVTGPPVTYLIADRASDPWLRTIPSTIASSATAVTFYWVKQAELAARVGDGPPPPSTRITFTPLPDPIPDAARLRISLTGFQGESRAYVSGLVDAIGAEFTNTLSIDNTHLITILTDPNGPPESDKRRTARGWGLTIVVVDWLEACVRAGALVDTAPYDADALERGEAIAPAATLVTSVVTPPGNSKRATAAAAARASKGTPAADADADGDAGGALADEGRLPRISGVHLGDADGSGGRLRNGAKRKSGGGGGGGGGDAATDSDGSSRRGSGAAIKRRRAASGAPKEAAARGARRGAGSDDDDASSSSSGSDSGSSSDSGSGSSGSSSGSESESSPSPPTKRSRGAAAATAGPAAKKAKTAGTAAPAAPASGGAKRAAGSAARSAKRTLVQLAGFDRDALARGRTAETLRAFGALPGCELLHPSSDDGAWRSGTQVLVVDAIFRTDKWLAASVSGVPIVRKTWIDACIAAGALLTDKDSLVAHRADDPTATVPGGVRGNLNLAAPAVWAVARARGEPGPFAGVRAVFVDGLGIAVRVFEAGGGEAVRVPVGGLTGADGPLLKKGGGAKSLVSGATLLVVPNEFNPKVEKDIIAFADDAGVTIVIMSYIIDVVNNPNTRISTDSYVVR